MKFLATLLTFAGYVLIYGAVAGPKGHPGRFALNPWMGVFYDAYTYGLETSPATSNTPPGPGWTRIPGGAGWQPPPLRTIPGTGTPGPSLTPPPRRRGQPAPTVPNPPGNLPLPASPFQP